MVKKTQHDVMPVAGGISPTYRHVQLPDYIAVPTVLMQRDTDTFLCKAGGVMNRGGESRRHIQTMERGSNRHMQCTHTGVTKREGGHASSVQGREAAQMTLAARL
jgi:hypothetical protein